MISRPAAPTYEEIAARAQRLWQLAGSPPNRDHEFWTAAESELKHERFETKRAAAAAPRSAPSGTTGPACAPRKPEHRVG